MHSSTPSSEQQPGIGLPFLWRFLAFAAPVVALVAAPEIALRARPLSQVPSMYAQKRAGLEARLPDLEVLVLGSSSTLYGVHAGAFHANAYNLAHVSESIWYHARLLERFIGQMPRLRLVIFSLAYPSMSYNLGQVTEGWRQFFYERYDGLPFEVEASPFDLRHYSVLRLFGPLVSKQGFFVLGLDMPGELHADDGWFCADQIKHNLDLENGADRLAVHELMMRDENYATNAATLDEAARVAHAAGATVAFIELPVRKEYSAAAKPQERARTRATLERLAQKYGGLYRDYFNDERFERPDFFDFDHLNKRGALRMTEIIDRDIVVPVMSGSKHP
jgi:hypothetical protein